MIVGIALQAWRQDKVNGPATEVQQTMVFPTIARTFARTLSPEHPRIPWRTVPYTTKHGGDLWGNPAVSRTLQVEGWGARAISTWRLTHDLTLFPMTDADYAELLKSHELPRNVGLRYTRALEARGAVMIGTAAVHPRSLAYTLPFMDEKLTETSVQDRVLAMIDHVNTMVETHQVSAIQDCIPDLARAKMAGPLQTRSVLGMDTPTPAVPAAALPAPAAAPVPEPVKDAPVKPGTKLTRPNGQVYVARKVDLGEDSISDVEMVRRGVRRGWCALAYGEPGTGKTASFDVAFNGMVTMLGTAETTADDFIGGYVQTSAEGYEWVDGPLVVAMEEGRVLFVDEVGLIDTRQLSVLYSVMDGRREIRVTANPQRQTVVAREGFGVVAATNPHAPGVRLSEALLSRFQIQLEVRSDYNIAADLGVSARAVQAAQHLDKLRTNQEVSWAPEMRDLLAFRDNEKEFGLVFALRALIGSAPEMDRDVVQAHLRERWGDLRNAGKLIRPLSVD